MYFYENHLYGNIYTTDYEQDYDDLYCEECGDSDTFVGEYDSWEDFIKEYDSDGWPFLDGQSLAECADIAIDKVYELNPKIKVYDEQYTLDLTDEDEDKGE